MAYSLAIGLRQELIFVQLPQNQVLSASHPLPAPQTLLAAALSVPCKEKAAYPFPHELKRTCGSFNDTTVFPPLQRDLQRYCGSQLIIPHFWSLRARRVCGGFAPAAAARGAAAGVAYCCMAHREGEARGTAHALLRLPGSWTLWRGQALHLRLISVPTTGPKPNYL